MSGEIALGYQSDLKPKTESGKAMRKEHLKTRHNWDKNPPRNISDFIKAKKDGLKHAQEHLSHAKDNPQDSDYDKDHAKEHLKKAEDLTKEIIKRKKDELKDKK